MKTMSGKDKVAMIGKVLTVVFKVFILATVLITFSWMAWWILTLVILVGIAWVLGVSNLVYLYLIFKEK